MGRPEQKLDSSERLQTLENKSVRYEFCDSFEHGRSQLRVCLFLAGRCDLRANRVQLIERRCQSDDFIRGQRLHFFTHSLAVDKLPIVVYDHQREIHLQFTIFAY